MGEVVIWGEVLFSIDFCMDFCALYFTAKLLGFPTGIKRLCCAAFICASAGVIGAVEMHAVWQIIVALCALLIAVWLMLPKNRRRFRCLISAILLFLILEACTGGVMTVLFYGLNRRFANLGVHVSGESARIRLFFLAAAVIFFLLGIIARMVSDADVKKLVKRGGSAEVRIGSRELHIPCLFDSGNLVREPISGKPVVFLPDSAKDHLGIDADLLSDGSIPGSRLIPLKTLDAETLRWAIRPDRMWLSADEIQIDDADVYLVFSERIVEAIVPTTLLQHQI